VPTAEKKVRKLLPEPKPQPKEEVVLKSGTVLFYQTSIFNSSENGLTLKAHKILLPLILFYLDSPSNFECSSTKN
jgi:hypothetical protein